MSQSKRQKGEKTPRNLWMFLKGFWYTKCRFTRVEIKLFWGRNLSNPFYTVNLRHQGFWQMGSGESCWHLAGTPSLPSSSWWRGMRVSALASYLTVCSCGLSSPSPRYWREKEWEKTLPSADSSPRQDNLSRAAGWMAEAATTYQHSKVHKRLIPLEKQTHWTIRVWTRFWL